MTLESEDEMKQAWEIGSYSEFAKSYLPMAGRLVEATAVDSGDRILDVGCGTGNVAITAARHGAQVTGLDITPTMLERAKTNAEIAGVDEIAWHEGNAVDLPFGENTFDVVLSNLGHMYADPAASAASELVRVTKPGGQIGFTSWTPTSLFPIIAGLVLTYLPPRAHPEFSEPPFTWGDQNMVEQWLDGSVENLSFTTETLEYPTLSPGHFWQEQTEQSGLFITFLDEIEERSDLRAEVIETVEPYFNSRENAVELEYLLTTASVTPPETTSERQKESPNDGK